MKPLAASYAAEYWMDECVSTSNAGTVAVGGPHVIEFASISALASWVQFHQLQPTEDAPQQFGYYRARRANGCRLSAEEQASIRVPTARASIFPEYPSRG